MTVLFGGEPLEKSEVARISEHTYKSRGKSLCEPILQPFWNWSAKFVPKKIAPNTLTVAGLAGNAISVALLIYYDPKLDSELPLYAVLLHIFSVFLYQTLDALDGLHARHTNTCSQLGELFDHGCDAISMFLLPLGYFCILGMGHHTTLMFIQFIILNCVFYTSHWQCYVTGVIEFDSFSVTEALLVSMGFSLVTAVFGVGFWDLKEPILGMELRAMQFVILVIGAFVLFCRFAQTLSVGGTGKYGTTVANTSVLFPVCPLALAIGSAVIIAIRSPTRLYQDNPSVFLLTFGAILAKISQNLVVAHMTKSGIRLWDTILIGPLCLHINQYFECLINEKWVLFFSCLWALTDLLNFSARVSIQVANQLNLYIFSVTRPPTRHPAKKVPSGIAKNSVPSEMRYLRSGTRK
ncbi:Cholinephosphotransferase 1 [Fasciolopsis buskii]|uniref:Cholinephosphotransferase 1 n=1 Tax=Fasciolopsis buskii TaxID=27845 RepID=A0A8E0S2E5_9TREM|nr:Cholinephosphotransferase 1 [Fasciolopsis buski]